MAAEYDFTSLNDKELEKFVLDLLNAKYKWKLQVFRAGRDKGVDLRYSGTEENPELIVQVKHYVNSGFSLLLSNLKREELVKIRKLKPKRYLLVTSVSLSVGQKDKIFKALQPFLLSSDDILGKEDLNSLLRDPDCKGIEKQWYKLWLSSTETISAILHNALLGRAQYFADEILKSVKWFVPSTNISSAISILQKHNVLLITGSPGIGKTSHAHYITLILVQEGYKPYQIESIKEAEDILSSDPGEKQLFYFDDFLGTNIYQLRIPTSSESHLARFIRRIRNSTNKLLILTSRTVILTQAQNLHDNFKNVEIELSQFELRIEDYSNLQKAKILYNHLYFGEISEKHLQAIIHEKFYKEIINHKNYNPRLIEFFTNRTKIQDFSSAEYKNYILSNLRNPHHIWKQSYLYQIDTAERCFLITLVTIGDECDLERLTLAYRRRIEYEQKNNGLVTNSESERKVIETLSKGFVTTYVGKHFSLMGGRMVLSTPSKPMTIFKLINPSLGDFLLNIVRENEMERISILNSAYYYEQIRTVVKSIGIGEIDLTKQKRIFEVLESDVTSTFFPMDRGEFVVRKISLLTKYCGQIDLSGFFIKHWGDIENETGIGSYIEELHLAIISNATICLFIEENFFEYIRLIVNNLDYTLNISFIKRVFSDFGINYSVYSYKREYIELMTSWFIEYAKELETEKKSDVSDDILSEDDIEFFYREIDDELSDIARELEMKYLLSSVERNFDEEHWKSVLLKNISLRDKKSPQLQNLATTSGRFNQGESDFEDEIDSLFENT